MPIFDLMIAFGTIALALVGIGAVTVIRRRDPRRLGRKNLESYLFAQSSTCPVCSKPTNPNSDLLVNDSWFHRECFDEVQP